ncbi:hypothetical protein O0L34_g19503 [Tuta absoluta]|nr:hypothetical protein O0L34_g19503 [Tuta absoluta]
MAPSPPPPPPLDLSKPKYDQSTYFGRAAHFFRLTNPFNLLTSDAQLDEANRVVQEYKKTKKMPAGYDEEKLWTAKYLVDSAFHPDTGEKMVLIGRMSAQAPMNTLITGAMITFYKTTAATVFWQWTNQTFNAIVNYTNRGGDMPVTQKQLTVSYLAAVGGALTTALVLNAKAKRMRNPIFQRLVPFAAVCGANAINIPMMRMNEINYGTPMFTDKGERVGASKTAAKIGIALVVLSRCFMAMPGMVLTPLVMNYGTKKGWFCQRPRLILPLQLAMVCACVTIFTPLGCALFTQMTPISTSMLEQEVQEAAKAKKVDTLYYNKGL